MRMFSSNQLAGSSPTQHFFFVFFICSFWFFVLFFFFRRGKKNKRPAPPPREASHTHTSHTQYDSHSRGPAMADSAEDSRGDRLEAVPSVADSSGDGPLLIDTLNLLG